MDELDIQIEKIKVSRMKPEERFLYNIFKESKLFHVKGKGHDSTLFVKNNIILCEYDNKRSEFHVDYNLVWSKLQDMNHRTVKQINDIIKKIVKLYFNIDVIPLWSTTQIRTKWIYFKDNNLY